MIAALVLAANVTARAVLIVNAGDDAIFAVSVGHLATQSWSGDLLGFDGAIDVSRGLTVRVPLEPATCSYDVKATYRGGRVVVLHDVDLCTADRLDFKD